MVQRLWEVAWGFRVTQQICVPLGCQIPAHLCSLQPRGRSVLSGPHGDRNTMWLVTRWAVL